MKYIKYMFLVGRFW